jgi:DNA-binding MarR family transcriptional regulator
VDKVSQRSGPRSLLKRGPKAARLARSAEVSPTEPAVVVPRRDSADMDAADSRLRNYRKHFTGGPENEVYFRATRAIVTAARRWRKLANDRVKPIGQTMARWETLFLVALSGDEITQGELARLISVEGPTMVRMLDVLAKDGLIARRQSSADRRVTSNRITPKGMRAIRDIMEITDKLRTEVMGNIDPVRLETFIDVSTQILRNIDELSVTATDGSAYPFDDTEVTKPRRTKGESR